MNSCTWLAIKPRRGSSRTTHSGLLTLPEGGQVGNHCKQPWVALNDSHPSPLSRRARRRWHSSERNTVIPMLQKRHLRHGRCYVAGTTSQGSCYLWALGCATEAGVLTGARAVGSQKPHRPPTSWGSFAKRSGTPLKAYPVESSLAFEIPFSPQATMLLSV